LVRVLIDLGADVNAQDAAGDTPLHLAAEQGHDDTCQQLLAGGASLTLRNSEGKIPGDVAWTEKLVEKLRPKSTE
jgi:ankyrin repeat protein